MNKLPINKIEERKPELDWKQIWINWNKLKYPKEITRIYEYIHDVWWTGEHAYKRKVIRILPK
jgi:hypothetical protein